MAYRQLTTEETILIYSLHRKGLGVSAIARELGRDKATISRELSRNSSSDPSIGYLYEAALFHRKERRRKANVRLRKISEGSPLALFIFGKLRDRWSPEQISNAIRWERKLPVVTHKTIYAFIKASHGEFRRYLLLLSHRKRRRKDGKKHVLIKDRRWIEERPKEVEDRTRLGDWEGDTIVSGCRKKAIATFADRASNYFMAARMEGRGAREMSQATIRLFAPLPPTKRHTCTNDNGTEFTLHQETEKALGMAMYFAHPYHSWERGINENLNRELRRFFPKKTLFSEIEDWELDWALHLINNRPRKRLGNRTPHQVFHGI
jgi:IS30 family transposase